MTVDIQIYAERRTATGWELAERLVPNPWLEASEAEEYPETSPPTWVMVPSTVVEGRGRNLNMVLTGASSPWAAEQVTPIAPLRGLPSDMSQNLRRWCEANCADTWTDCEDFGWLGLNEILEHDWDQPVLMEALVEPENAELFADPPGPYPRHGWIGPIHHWGSGGNGTRVRWVNTHRELARELVEEAVPRLVKLVDDPTNLRLVFWVD